MIAVVFFAAGTDRWPFVEAVAGSAVVVEEEVVVLLRFFLFALSLQT